MTDEDWDRIKAGEDKLKQLHKTLGQLVKAISAGGSFREVLENEVRREAVERTIKEIKREHDSLFEKLVVSELYLIRQWPE